MSIKKLTSGLQQLQQLRQQGRQSIRDGRRWSDIGPRNTNEGRNRKGGRGREGGEGRRRDQLYIRISDLFVCETHVVVVVVVVVVVACEATVWLGAKQDGAIKIESQLRLR